MAPDDDRNGRWFDLADDAIRGSFILGGFAIVGAFGDSIAHVFAGQTTHVTFSMTLTVSIAITGVATTLLAWGRVRALNREKKRMDRRLRSLEAENERFRSNTPLPLMPGPGTSSPPPR